MAIVLAMIADAIFGEPKLIWSRVPHPAVLMGNLIGWFDCWVNLGSRRRLRGTIVLIGLVIITWAIGALLAALPGFFVEVVVGAILIAQRSLSDHVFAVARGLDEGLEQGREEVAKIVGRDTAEMEDHDVARAAIESAAENFSDGVVAPVFWFVIAGLPGLLVYKMVNTCDSMIGYRTKRYEEFGWASARTDDLMNWVPARISALLIVFASLKFSAAKGLRRSAASHRSPNAGWPEAAMAGALGIALSGPRKYDGIVKDYPWLNAQGRKMLRSEDVRNCVVVLWKSWCVLLAVVVLLYLVAMHW